MKKTKLLEKIILYYTIICIIVIATMLVYHFTPTNTPEVRRITFKELYNE